MWTLKISPGKALGCVEDLLAFGFAETDCLDIMSDTHGNNYCGANELLEAGVCRSVTLAQLKSWCEQELSVSKDQRFKPTWESDIPSGILKKLERQPQAPRSLNEYTLNEDDVDAHIGKLIAALEDADNLIPEFKVKLAILRLQEAKFLLEDLCERRIIRVRDK